MINKNFIKYLYNWWLDNIYHYKEKQKARQRIYNDIVKYIEKCKERVCSYDFKRIK